MTYKIADMHVHSYYSDGTMTPEEILNSALNNGVGLLAIADHERLDGSLKLLELCKEYNIQCIPAVEVDALDNGNNIHILGYGMNPYDKEFCSFIKRNRVLLDEISIKLIEKMQRDYDTISLEEFSKFNYDRKKGGWKALHYFYEKGLTKSLKEGFIFYQIYNCSYDCVEFHPVSLAIQFIHNAGGKAILAHPGETIKEKENSTFREEVLRLVSFGLDGIECYYPTHTSDMTDICLEICKAGDMLITAGSDCHGDFGRAKIGEMGIEISQLKLGNLI